MKMLTLSLLISSGSILAQTNSNSAQVGDQILCGENKFTVTALKANGNADVRIERARSIDEFENYDIRGCENITVLKSQTQNGNSVGNSVRCGANEYTITAFLKNGNAAVSDNFSEGSSYGNMDIRSCENFSLINARTQNGYSIGDQLECEGQLVTITAFRRNQNADLDYSHNPGVMWAFDWNIRQCEQISSRINQSERNIQSDRQSVQVNRQRSSSRASRASQQ